MVGTYKFLDMYLIDFTMRIYRDLFVREMHKTSIFSTDKLY